MKSTLLDREFNKFRDGSNGEAVAVTYDGTSPMPVDTSGVDWDEIVTTFPSDREELYTYKKGSVTVQTVFVEYEANNKKNIVYINKTRL
jgi:hypothetical protein